MAINSNRSTPPPLMPWSVMVTFEFCSMFWKRLGPGGKNQTRSFADQSVERSNRESCIPFELSIPSPFCGGADEPPAGYGKLPTLVSKGVADIVGVEERSRIC